MRKVDRTLVPEPAILQKKGTQEAEKARSFYTTLRQKEAQAQQKAAGVAKKKKDSFEFRLYKEAEVKEALERLFLGKCAYCEGRYAGTQPVDIEHWRPKGKVVDVDEEGKIVREIKPGYYWLAARWENLLPSCIDCNREREQTLVLPGTKKVVGKANQFPLAQGSPRATEDQPDLDAEQPLLLNPCTNDSPEDYLEFDPDEAVVQPQGDPLCYEKATASILVYGLNRLGLVQERKEVLLLLKKSMYTVEQLALLLEDEKLGAGSREIAEDLLCHELEGLRRFCEPDRPFTLMARQVVDKFIRRLTGEPAW
jgi:hypothetical protein